LGRDHTATEARRAIERARHLFPGQVTFDLIFGRAGQTEAAWRDELEQAIALADNHMSIYQLMVERGTP
jgi:coproporphyrinogen III oxidase-like Fe-S oxidoreductase